MEHLPGNETGHSSAPKDSERLLEFIAAILENVPRKQKGISGKLTSPIPWCNY